MTKEELKPFIDEILKYYFNRKTRFNYDSKMQYNMLAQNKGLTNACYALIEFCDDKNALVEYTNSKIDELNNWEAEDVRLKG